MAPRVCAVLLLNVHLVMLIKFDDGVTVTRIAPPVFVVLQFSNKQL